MREKMESTYSNSSLPEITLQSIEETCREFRRKTTKYCRIDALKMHSQTLEYLKANFTKFHLSKTDDGNIHRTIMGIAIYIDDSLPVGIIRQRVDGIWKPFIQIEQI